MKFTDIRQFTSSGSYQIDVPVDYLITILDKYREHDNLQMNPDFQRGNVWTEEQQIKYLEFFFRGGKSANIIYFNCPSYGRVTDRCNYPDMVLVDGLQRLTAFIRFLNNEIPIFGTYYKDFEDRPRMSSGTLKFNVNDLQTRAEVLRWYIEMNSGGVVHTDEEIKRVEELLRQESEHE